MMGDEWTILCVLAVKGHKAGLGGVYTVEHAARLVANLRRTFTQAERVLCLTDVPEDVLEAVPDVEVELLTGRHMGWWNKTELFRDDIRAVCGDGAFLYMDLDMVPLRPFSLPLPGPNDFYMWRDRLWWERTRDFNSSIMAWRGDYEFVWDSCSAAAQELFAKKGDQEFTRRTLQGHKKRPITIYPVDDLVRVYDWKMDKLAGTAAPPPDAQVIAFHGEPRPWDVTDPWLKEAYHGSRD